MSARASEHSPTPALSTPDDAPRDRWLTGLDGLRAIAVLAVLGFHAGFASLTGGFLGVDVFFVISGYLITALLLREFDTHGRIDIRAFWLRRARRLLPALFFLLAGVVVFAVLVLPDEVARLRADVLAAVAYVTNWYLIVDQQSYVEAIGRPSMLRHLWSLAVEEQFYLLWPLVLVAALVVLRRRGALVLTVGLAAVSAIWMAVLFDPDADPSRVYYGTDTRLSGLLIGAALAFVWVPGVRNVVAPAVGGSWQAVARRWGPDVVALMAIAALGVAFVSLDLYGEGLYRGGFVVVALITAALIAAVVHPASVVGRRVLDSSVPRWIGQRSYSIYLWHWPVFAVTRPGVDVGLLFWPDLALRLAATFALAALSYRFIEMPVREGALGRLWQAWRTTGGPRTTRIRLAFSTSAVLITAAVLLVAGQVAAARPASPPDYIPQASFQAIVAAPAPSDHSGAIAIAIADPSADPPADPAASDDSGGVIYSDDDPSDDPGASGSAAAGATPSAIPTTASGAGGQAGGTSSDPGATTDPDPTALATAEPSTQLAAGSIPTPTPAAATTSAPTTAPTAQTTAQSSQSAEPAAPAATPAPTPKPTPTGPPAKVLAVGDSVMLGAARALGKAFGRVEVDAAISRPMTGVIRILADRKSAGRLPDIVIVHTGTNGPVTSGQLQDLMAAVSGVDHVVLLDDRVPNDYEGHNNRMFAQLAQKYPNVIFVDWHAATEGRSDLFWNDGTHTRPEGSTFYANLITSALRDAGVSWR